MGQYLLPSSVECTLHTPNQMMCLNGMYPNAISTYYLRNLPTNSISSVLFLFFGRANEILLSKFCNRFHCKHFVFHFECSGSMRNCMDFLPIAVLLLETCTFKNARTTKPKRSNRRNAVASIRLFGVCFAHAHLYMAFFMRATLSL